MANEVAKIQKDITEQVIGKLDGLKQEGLVLPKNYNPSNALKSAFFALTNSPSGNLLEQCDNASTANALLDMVTQGLSPAKTQCYFIKYGNQLKLNRSYFGTQAVLKRLSNVKEIWANIIYDDDDFVIAVDHGREEIVKHDTAFENRDKAIKGAYAIIETNDGKQVLTTMTIKEIQASWNQSKTKQDVHKKFPQEMAKRTVINRAAKAFINTSDDSDLLIQAINNSTENEYESDPREIHAQEVDHEIATEANTEEFETAQNEEPEQFDEPQQTEEVPKAEQAPVADVDEDPF